MTSRRSLFPSAQRPKDPLQASTMTAMINDAGKHGVKSNLFRCAHAADNRVVAAGKVHPGRTVAEGLVPRLIPKFASICGFLETEN